MPQRGIIKLTTLIAAVRLKGPQAPWLFGGAMDGELFLAWVNQGLVPRLQPDDVVVMDDLATHKVAGGGAGGDRRHFTPTTLLFIPDSGARRGTRVRLELAVILPRPVAVELLLQKVNAVGETSSGTSEF